MKSLVTKKILMALVHKQRFFGEKMETKNAVVGIFGSPFFFCLRLLLHTMWSIAPCCLCQPSVLVSIDYKRSTAGFAAALPPLVETHQIRCCVNDGDVGGYTPRGPYLQFNIEQETLHLETF